MKNSQKGSAAIWVIIILIVVIVISGIYWYVNQNSSQSIISSENQTQQTQQNVNNTTQPVRPVTQTSSQPIQPSITITSPKGGETWVLGNPFTVTWTSKGITSAPTVSDTSFVTIKLTSTDNTTVCTTETIDTLSGTNTVVPSDIHCLKNGVSTTMTPGTYKIGLSGYTSSHVINPDLIASQNGYVTIVSR